MTRTEQRLRKARKLFRVGTRFTSLFGADDFVTRPPALGKKREPAQWADEHGDIYVWCGWEARLVFDAQHRSWAKRILR